MSSSNTTLDPVADPTSEPASEMAKPIEEDHGDEKNSNHSEVLRDIILGAADGLTVPFALTAGLSSLGSSKLVVIGGLAELFSGAISMGLGAYLACVADGDHYEAEEARERREIEDFPATETQECYELLEKYGIAHDTLTPVINELVANNDQWVKFMMDFELQLEKPKWYRKYVSAATMGLSYFIGGLIPMIPYFAMHDVTHALFISIGITAIVLLVFGYIKNWVTVGTKKSATYGAFQTLFVGGLAAAASYGTVRGLDSKNPVSTD